MLGAERAVWRATQAIRNDAARPSPASQLCKLLWNRPLASREARAAVAEFLQRFDPTKNRVAKIYICGGGANFYVQALRERLGAYKIEVMNDSGWPTPVGSGCMARAFEEPAQQRSGQIWPLL